MYMLKQIKFKQIIKISVRVNCEDRLLIEDVIYLFLFFLKLKNEKLNVNTFKGIKNRERERERETNVWFANSVSNCLCCYIL